MEEKRHCKICSAEVEIETCEDIDYPYYCPSCDENRYEFETATKEEILNGKN